MKTSKKVIAKDSRLIGTLISNFTYFVALSRIFLTYTMDLLLPVF